MWSLPAKRSNPVRAAALDCFFADAARNDKGRKAVSNMPHSIKTKEAAELLRLRPRRAETVGRMSAVAVADRDRAKQHLLRRHVYERPDNPMHTRPGFLRAGVEPVSARQIHQRMNIAAEIGPLAGTEAAIDGDEQSDRHVEELVIALVLVKPRRGVVAIDRERAVKLHAMTGLSRNQRQEMRESTASNTFMVRMFLGR